MQALVAEHGGGVCIGRDGENEGYGVDYVAKAKRLLNEDDGAGLRLRWLAAGG